LLVTVTMSALVRALSRSGLVLGATLSLGGCYARAGVEPAYVETTYVPAHVERYPSYYYDGRTVYLIDGRWYYRQPGGRWVYYRREPPVLYRQRITVRQAPPARPAPHYRQAPPRQAPPAYYRDDGRRYAPPAAPRKDPDDRDHRDGDGRHRDGHRHDRDGY
jgi:hypothetical protein